MSGIDAAYLLAQAERCRRLARDTTDIAARHALLEMAEEYAAMARELGDSTPVASGNSPPIVG